jgi:hypothetical protein
MLGLEIVSIAWLLRLLLLLLLSGQRIVGCHTHEHRDAV